MLIKFNMGGGIMLLAIFAGKEAGFDGVIGRD